MQMVYTRSTSPSVFINHIHLYPIITVTLFPLFLKDFIRQIGILHAVSRIIMESVNCFGKKPVQVGKCFIAVLTEFFKKVSTKHFSELSEFSIITDLLVFKPAFTCSKLTKETQS